MCANCKTYGKDCIFEPLTESPRAPSTSHVDTRPSRRRPRPAPRIPTTRAPSDGPEDDSRSGNGEQLIARSGPSPLSTVEQARPSPHRPRSRDGLPSPGVARLVVSANGLSSYHGQTSALFDENPQDRLHGEFRPRIPDEWVEKGLVAEAAKQRE